MKMDLEMDSTMLLENKLLLVYELCTRLPRGVWVELNEIQAQVHIIEVYPHYDNNDNICDYDCRIDFFEDGNWIDITNFKLALDPDDDDFELLTTKNLAVKRLW